MSPVFRKVALMLHSVSDEDRRWMLARLPESSRHVLTSLVDEIATLGFEPEPTLQALNFSLSAYNSEPVNTPVTEKPEKGSAIEVIDALPVSVLVMWIENEDEWLVAQLLACHEWSWTAECLHSLNEKKRIHLQRVRQDIHLVPTLVKNQLLIQLANHLENEFHNISEVTLSNNHFTKVKHTIRFRKWLRSFVRRA